MTPRAPDRFAPDAKLLVELLIGWLPVANRISRLDTTAQDLPAFGQEIEEAVGRDPARCGRFPL
jgi:hypothetical protein